MGNDKPTLDSLTGVLNRALAIGAEMEALMSGRDDREATTERERRKREDAEEKARKRDAVTEAETDRRSLSDFAKRRIADLEDERDAYCKFLVNQRAQCHKLAADISILLERHQENPDE
jgi:hypothetical protein